MLYHHIIMAIAPRKYVLKLKISFRPVMVHIKLCTPIWRTAPFFLLLVLSVLNFPPSPCYIPFYTHSLSLILSFSLLSFCVTSSQTLTFASALTLPLYLSFPLPPATHRTIPISPPSSGLSASCPPCPFDQRTELRVFAARTIRTW